MISCEEKYRFILPVTVDTLQRMTSQLTRLPRLLRFRLSPTAPGLRRSSHQPAAGTAGAAGAAGKWDIMAAVCIGQYHLFDYGNTSNYVETNRLQT